MLSDQQIKGFNLSLDIPTFLEPLQGCSYENLHELKSDQGLFRNERTLPLVTSIYSDEESIAIIRLEFLLVCHVDCLNHELPVNIPTD